MNNPRFQKGAVILLSPYFLLENTDKKCYSLTGRINIKIKKMSSRLENNQKGLTIIELLLACLILAVLASVVIPRYQDIQKRAAINAEKYLSTIIKNGTLLYKNGLLE